MNRFLWTTAFIFAALIAGWKFNDYYDFRNPLLVDVRIDLRNPLVYAMATPIEKEAFYAQFTPAPPPAPPLPWNGE